MRLVSEFERNSINSLVSLRASSHPRRRGTLSGMCGVLVAMVFGTGTLVMAQTATTTTLTVASGGERGDDCCLW